MVGVEITGGLARDFASAEYRPRVLVIGYGNPLRLDDGIGWRVTEELQP